MLKSPRTATLSLATVTAIAGSRVKKGTPDSNVLFCPQPKDIQFTVIEEERDQKIFTFKKLESENFDFKNV